MFRILLLSIFTILLFTPKQSKAQTKPLKVAVIGLTHTHVHWILGREQRGDIEIVGIVEQNQALAKRYTDQHGYSMDFVYTTMQALVDSVEVEAVTAFGTIYDHLEIVEFFAPKGIHVMVEKPLAVSIDHAQKMAALARKHNIYLLTNYETTWYPSNYKAYALAKQDTAIGDIRKIIVRDGHRGPKKIGVNEEFLEWLTDPVLNGGGALTDFGCYGANLSTWLMDGQKPLRVTAVTQQLQAENNPKVNDEALIILDYGHANTLIQASWNWPMGRKDMEIYGLTGALYSDNRNVLRLRIAEGYDGFEEQQFDLEAPAAPYDDPFAYLAAVIRGDIKVLPTDLSALENNLIVVEILEAASVSAKEGRTVVLEK